MEQWNNESMEQAQHHSSAIEQKSTLSTSEISNQEELNALCYNHHSLPKKPFQKKQLKQSQNFDHRDTYQQSQKQHNSSNQNECNCCGAKGHRGSESR